MIPKNLEWQLDGTVPFIGAIYKDGTSRYIADTDNIGQEGTVEIVRRYNTFEGLLDAGNEMAEYFKMLEKSTGVKHGCLETWDTAIAAVEAK